MDHLAGLRGASAVAADHHAVARDADLAVQFEVALAVMVAPVQAVVMVVEVVTKQAAHHAADVEATEVEVEVADNNDQWSEDQR